MEDKEYYINCAAMAIVNHTNEANGVDVDTRQKNNDECFDYAVKRIGQYIEEHIADCHIPPPYTVYLPDMTALKDIPPQVFPVSKTPHKCPVCGGSGIVPGGFYNTMQKQWTASQTTEKCRACQNGIIWG